MGKRNRIFLLIAALLFTGFVNLEPFAHGFENKHSDTYEYECEFCENHNSIESPKNSYEVFSFSIEITYLFNPYIHISLLEKPFLSRAPPKN
tara:strand:- start:5796 stop:6071 length:276 start_codon:yes stop_codon:yes gene_type:complete